MGRWNICNFPAKCRGGGKKVDQLGILDFKEDMIVTCLHFPFASYPKLGVEAASNSEMPKPTD